MSGFPYTACLIVPPVGDAILASAISRADHASRGDGLRSCEVRRAFGGASGGPMSSASRSLKQQRDRSMTLSINTNNLQPHSYTIYRPEGEIDGYRQVRDPAGGLAVTAYPIAMAKDLGATCELLSACYVIAGHGQALICGR